MKEVLLQTNLPGIKLLKRGKVRDVYDLGDELLVVATDRISAYDVVMPNGIPGKGVVLNQMSLFWFNFTRELVANHVIAGNFSDYPAELQPFEDQLAGRSMLVQEADPVVPFECVVRGYLAGSGWRDYRETGKVCDIELPPDLRESERLSEPIFTPATKAEQGHDENVSFLRLVRGIGEGPAYQLRSFSIALYKKAAEYAEARGIIIADTKLEFGMTRGGWRLIDEVFTSDSSRFWPKDQYEPGRPQDSFDKQFLRDWLDSIGWDHKPPAPQLPPDIVQKTAEKYKEAYERLVGTAVGTV